MPCDRMEAKADKMPNWLSFYLPKAETEPLDMSYLIMRMGAVWEVGT